ncbi:hypothetical protein [Micromonospora globispora]|uniref:hypothetical protein n=1 Tax=Micromonospora globispora TaxID=1450148 RepID=UPI000F5EFED7|nr:hypothetical protein [Micromonospora globispora]RQW84032.1 hypothetical protein DKL51_30615 [Micromonospora globispora]
MRVNPRYGVGLLLAAASVLWWAVGMAVLQPLTEPAGPWSEVLPGNNTYWARDLRFTALIAIVLGLVLAAGGRRVPTRIAALLGVGWLLADVAVDRSDLEGWAYVAPLAIAGCAVLAGAVLLLRRRPGDDVDEVAARRTLLVCACVAAVLAVFGAGVESPTDREPQLTWAGLTTGVLMLALTLSCALAAAGSVTGARRWLTAGLAMAGLAGLTATRLLPPDPRVLPMWATAVLLLTGITLLAWDHPDGRPHWGRHVLAGVSIAVGLPVLVIILVTVTNLVPIGPVMTALSGNISISDADSDVLVSMVGLVAGLVIGVFLARQIGLGYSADCRHSEPGQPVGKAGQDSL